MVGTAKGEILKCFFNGDQRLLNFVMHFTSKKRRHHSKEEVDGLAGRRQGRFHQA
jgi:hypothetical protein